MEAVVNCVCIVYGSTHSCGYVINGSFARAVMYYKNYIVYQKFNMPIPRFHGSYLSMHAKFSFSTLSSH